MKFDSSSLQVFRWISNDRCVYLVTEICFDSLISEGYDKVCSLVIDQYTSHAKVEEIQKDR